MTADIRWVVREGEAGPLSVIVGRAGGDAAAVAEGRVFVGRRRALSEEEAVAPGDEVTIAAHREGGDVTILANEDDVVAADKPAGMPTIADQSGASHTLVAAVARALGVPPARVHATSRLDRAVSGVVLLALSAAAAERLAQARKAGSYARRYVAIASRAPSPPRGVWDAPIGRARDPRKRAALGREATFAVTRFATVSRVPAGALVSAGALLALAPVTGRTHQLRVHASHAGAPLLGDRDYGGPSRLTLPGGRVLPVSRIALHAARVSVPRPDGSAFVVGSPVPADLRDLWGALGGGTEAWDCAIDAVLDEPG